MYKERKGGNEREDMEGQDMNVGGKGDSYVDRKEGGKKKYENYPMVLGFR